MKKLTGECLSEAVGTFMLVFFGCGSVATAVITDAHLGLWQVAMVWGFAISLIIYATSAVSGAHINPAVTIAMAIYKKNEFPAKKILPYISAQVLGGFLGGAILYALYRGLISHFETVNHIVRGEAGSQLSAMMFGEYFPNPAIYGTSQEAFRQVSLWNACLAETVGTAFLLFFILALTDNKNPHAPHGESKLFAFFIGFAVAVIIAIIAPFTQAALNPARDFGPRLFSFLMGWGTIAIPGPRGGFFFVYIVSPILGGLLGGFIYNNLIRRYFVFAKGTDQSQNRSESDLNIAIPV